MPPKVWLVLIIDRDYDYSDTEVLGAFSSKEAADDFCAHCRHEDCLRQKVTPTLTYDVVGPYTIDAWSRN